MAVREQQQQPPVGTVALRAAGGSLSAALVGVLLLVVALAGAGAAYDLPPPGVIMPIWPALAEPGQALLHAGLAALAVGGGLLVLAMLGSLAASLVQTAGGRNVRVRLLMLGQVGSLAAIPAIAYGAVQLLDHWASNGQVSAGAGDVPRLFAMILLGLDPPELSFSGLLWSESRWLVVCVASWIALALAVGVAIAAGRSLRRRAGLAVGYLRIEAMLSLGAGAASITALVFVLAWSIRVPAQRLYWDGCPVCQVVTGNGPPAFSVIWWGVLAAIVLAGARSLWTGIRALSATRRLATA